MKSKFIMLILLLLAWIGCGDKKTEGVVEESTATESKKEVVKVDPMSNKGIGPISAVDLGEVNNALVAQGETEFKAKCTACHKISKRHIGPALKGVTDRRSPEWIMNMILNPEEMVSKDPIAKQLLVEYNGAPMANQNLTEEEARTILEYLRTKK